ncbi:hypothetical protein Purlil1_12516 [Purpureocillium lilacinum]|uniref:Uncharacterized protein n=1 Tax=Purpureocillium lilacinum TaxID=33203 RepID=A0ABR0BGP0_PURLI|nr:hypothetical protein Purlil1_12516 [Purpureocillium lilacinum]
MPLAVSRAPRKAHRVIVSSVAASNDVHGARAPQVPISSLLFAYFDIPLEARCPIARRPPHQSSANDANPNSCYHNVHPGLLQVTSPQASSPDIRLGKHTQPNKGTVRRGNAPFDPNVSREAIICDPTRELTAASDHLNAESATRLLPGNTITCGTNGYTMRKTESSVVAFPDPTGNWAASTYSLVRTLLLAICDSINLTRTLLFHPFGVLIQSCATDTTADDILPPALLGQYPALSGADWPSHTTDNDMDKLNCLTPLFDGSDEYEGEASGEKIQGGNANLGATSIRRRTCVTNRLGQSAHPRHLQNPHISGVVYS